MYSKNILTSNLRFLRKLLGLSQEQLSELIYKTRSCYGSWEDGRVTPDIFSLKRLSELHGVTLEELLETDLSAKRKEAVND